MMMAEDREWRLLLVDDDADDYHLTAQRLDQFKGRRVALEWVFDYPSAVDRLTSHNYDAVLIDYDLGAYSGIDLIRRFSSELDSTPLILYTGRGSYEVDIEAMQAGATLYLTKSEANPLLLERSIRYAIERKQIEAQQRRLNCTLRAISNSNQALIHAVDEIQLLNDVCRIVVQDCGHTLVWAGIAEHDESRTVRPVAHFGFDSDYIESMDITWADEPRGRGPSGTAIRTGQISHVRDIRSDPAFEPWREAALRRGYAASLALPLVQDGEALGVLNIYATRPNSFSEEEINLLAELASDVAFGLTTIRLRRAKADADENLQYLASFPQQNPNPIIEADLDGSIRHMNPSARQLIPDLPELKMEHPWLAAWPQVTAALLARPDIPLVRDVKTGGRVYQQTIVLVPDRRFARIYASDITDRYTAELALRQSEERFRLALQNMPMVVANLDRDLRYTWIYNPVEGFKAEDVIGKPIAYSADPGTREETHRILNELLATGEPRSWESVIATQKGELTLNTIAEPLRNDAGEIIGVAFVAINITERKQVEQQLRDSEQKFHTIYQSAPFGIVLVSLPDGKIVDANDVFVNLLEFHKDDLIGKSPVDLNLNPDFTAVKRFFNEFQEHRSLRNVETDLYTRTGKQITASINMDLISLGGRPYLLASLEDITRRRLTEKAVSDQNERLRLYAAELERSNHALEDFAFVAAHDLQEPLRKVKAFGDLLKMRLGEQMESEAQDYINRIQSASERMQTMLNGLLAYSRISTQGSPFQMINLNNIVGEVVSDLEWRINQVNARVACDELPSLEADPHQMRQLFQNLLVNALKFCRSDGPPQVTVSGEIVADSTASICISDNGIGFEDEKAGELFQPFHRLHTKSQYDGSGMGLAICRKIVERHNGKITAHGSAGRGASFTITLPICQTS